MNYAFHAGNRQRLYAEMKTDSLLVIFSGKEIRKTNDEYYPFFANRSFVYLTGIQQKESVLVAMKGSDSVEERLYILAPDAMAERWTGRRLKPAEVETISGIHDIRYIDQFASDFHALVAGGHYSQKTASFEHLYLDLFRADVSDVDLPAHLFLKHVQSHYPYISIENANALVRKLRLIKQPCEIEALRKAESITREGILAMMKISKPGMYEYQYKAAFDYALGQYSPDGPGFPSIISADKNNFCIHYYSYTGRAEDGDMILNDVGAQWDGLITDVSRGWPCNGKFSEKQKRLYECALDTSNHMFSIIKPGTKMADVDKTIRMYNAERLRDAGVIRDASEIGSYMWHGGAHHIGYDVHDVIASPEYISSGMVFCVDVGIYHEEWGIGFRLEDNCLVTDNGCENLSAATPRTIEDIESVMRKTY